MADDAIEVEFELHLEDVVAFSVWDWKRSQGYKGKLREAIFLSFLVLALLWILFSSNALSPWLFFVVGFGAGMVCVCVLLLVFMPSEMRKAVVKKFDGRRNALLFSRHKMCFSLQGIHNDTNLSNAYVSWVGVDSVERGDSSIYIYLTGMMAWIVPKRAFADEAAFEGFYQTCLEYWNAAKGREPAAEGAA